MRQARFGAKNDVQSPSVIRTFPLPVESERKLFLSEKCFPIGTSGDTQKI